MLPPWEPRGVTMGEGQIPMAIVTCHPHSLAGLQGAAGLCALLPLVAAARAPHYAGKLTQLKINYMVVQWSPAITSAVSCPSPTPSLTHTCIRANLPPALLPSIPSSICAIIGFVMHVHMCVCTCMCVIVRVCMQSAYIQCVRAHVCVCACVRARMRNPPRKAGSCALHG